MSNANADASRVPTQNSAVTIHSPNRGTQTRPQPQATQSAAVRTEHPVDPVNPRRAYGPPVEEGAIGNPTAIMCMKLEGLLGDFYPLNLTTRRPTLVEMNFDNIHGAVSRALRYALTEAARKERSVDELTNTEVIDDLVLHLSNGVLIMFYLKLRIVNFLDTRAQERYRTRPMVPSPFEVPSPFALAINQLGAIKLGAMESEIYLSPHIPAAVAASHGCPPNTNWSPVDYSRCVSLAKKFGLRFSSVDLTVKIGSSWWLFRPVNEGRAFRLDCPYAEENFTSNTAVLAALFCSNATGGFNNPIVDVEALGTRTFGTFLKTPPINIHMNVFYGIAEEPEITYLVED